MCMICIYIVIHVFACMIYNYDLVGNPFIKHPSNSPLEGPLKLSKKAVYLTIDPK